MKKYLVYAFISLLSLGGLFFYQQGKFNDNKLHVVFCDVGQGDAIYIRTPENNDILIDGGPNDKVLNCLNNHMPFWDRDLELVVLTHPHADHVAGLISVLQRYNVIAFATADSTSSTDIYKELLKELKAKSIKQKTLVQGDRFMSPEGVVLVTEQPEASSLIAKSQETSVLGSKAEYFDQNESSVIDVLTYKNFDVLLTGDADINSILDSAKGKRIEVLKVSHHGSKTGTNKKLLEEIMPELAVISVGKNNRYNLPYPQTIKDLKDLGIKYLRTDEAGDIEIISDGKSWQVN